MNRTASITLILSAAMACVLAIAGTASGEDGEFEQGGLVYALDGDGTVTVVGYGSVGATVTVPSAVTYEGTEYTVDSIGERAFRFCGTVETVFVSDSVKEIGERAFSDCDSLEYVYIGEGVESLPPYLFDNSRSLTTVEGMLGLVAIEDNAFRDAWVDEIRVPDSVTTLGDGALKGVDVGYIWIGSGVTEMGEDVFGTPGSIEVSPDNPEFASQDGVLYDKGMTVLIKHTGHEGEGFSVPDSVTSIADSAFFLSSVASVDLGNVVSIGDGAFRDASIRTLELPASVVSVGSSAFEGSDLTSVTVDGPEVHLGDRAFASCQALAEVHLGEGVVSIGDEAFADCISLLSADIPDSVTSLGDSVFSGCTSLVSVSIGGGIAEVPFELCMGCTSLEEIDGLDGCTSIGDYAFDHTAMERFEIPDSVVSIGSRIVSGPALRTVSIGSGLSDVGGYNFEGEAMESIEVSPDNTSFASQDGALYDKGMTTLVRCPGGLTEFVVPDGIVAIGEEAFSDASVVSVTLPDGLLEIGDRAFFYCYDLSQVDIPDTVTYIGVATFMGCDGLRCISIPASVSSVGDAAFENSGLERVRILSDTLDAGDLSFGVSGVLSVYSDGYRLPESALGYRGAVYYAADQYSEVFDDGDDPTLWAAVVVIIVVAVAAAVLYRRFR